MQVVEAARDERDLRAMKGFRFDKLRGGRGKKGEHSLRLNDQWRLIVTIEEDEDGRLVAVRDISRHYAS